MMKGKCKTIKYFCPDYWDPSAKAKANFVRETQTKYQMPEILFVEHKQIFKIAQNFVRETQTGFGKFPKILFVKHKQNFQIKCSKTLQNITKYSQKIA